MSFTNISESTAVDKGFNPYIGPRAFQRGEQLYGRDREARQLVNLIVAERIVLLYSPSGAGKTSLIQAAILPQLERMKFQALPVVRVHLIPGGVNRGEINRYTYSALLSLEEDVPPAQRVLEADLVQMSLHEYLSARPKPDGGRGIEVLIFDQFEEILTLDPIDRAEKEEFFRQLGEALDAPNRWALFSMREDYLAALDPYVLAIPNHFRATYRLDLLGVEAARQAIQEPARVAGVEFQEAAAHRLVDDLRRVSVQGADGRLEPQLGLYVEPVQLQVVCYRLWAGKRLQEGKITEQDLASYGQVEQSLVDQSLAEYYFQCVQEAAQETGVREREIREWVDHHLVTEGGVRGTVVMGPKRSGGLDNRAIWSLVDAHLVRGEKRGGATWFELAHDRLLNPVRASNSAWRSEHLSLLQQQASLWVTQGRPESLLQRGQDLVDAERWADEHRGEMLTSEIDFLEASRKLQGRERRARLLNRVILALGMVAIVLAGLAFSASLNAQRQARLARAGQLSAQAQAGLELYPIRSLLLAIEANSANTGDEIRSAAAQEALRGAVRSPHGWFLYGSVDAVNQTVFSPDGRWLATGNEDGAALVYEMDSIEPAETPEYRLELDSPIRAMAFSPDGRWLATGYKNGTARLWDLQAQDPALEPLILLGHADTITAIGFSPDGRWLATGSLDGSARLWDLQADNLITDPIVFTCPDGGVETLAFSPDNGRLATASSNIVRLWALNADQRAEEPLVLNAPFLLIRTMAFSPDGRWLATGSSDRAWLWDLQGEDPPANLIGLTEHFDWVNSVAFSPDGQWLASGSGDGIARLWALGTIEDSINPILLVGHDDWINEVAFSPDGHFLATSSGDHTVRLWDLTVENPSETPIILRGHDDWVNAMAFSPDGRWLATGGEDQSTRIWELPAMEADANPLVLEWQDQGIDALDFSPDGKWLISGGYPAMLRNWDGDAPIPTSEARLFDKSYYSLSLKRFSAIAFNRDGRWLATAKDQHIELWDLGASDPNAGPIIMAGHEGVIEALAFSPDGRWLASGSWDNTIRLWDLRTPDRDFDVKVLGGHQGAINALAFSPNGRWLASGSADNTARVWDLRAADPAAEPFILEGHEDDIFDLAFNPDSEWLATASGDQTARLWGINDEGPTGEDWALREHEDQVRSLAFSPDGRWLVTGSWDETARLWDMKSANPAENSLVLLGHQEWIMTLAISPDSRWLATGSSDRTIRMWDLDAVDPSANPVILSGHEGQVNILAFSPDGRWLASGSEDATTRLWLVQPADLIRLACRSAGRNFTSVEWQQYFPGERYRKTCEEWTDTP